MAVNAPGIHQALADGRAAVRCPAYHSSRPSRSRRDRCPARLDAQRRPQSAAFLSLGHGYQNYTMLIQAQREA